MLLTKPARAANTDEPATPFQVDPAAWTRASRSLITHLEDPKDRTALRRRLSEVHRNATTGFTEPPADPTALNAADLYSYLTEI